MSDCSLMTDEWVRVSVWIDQQADVLLDSRRGDGAVEHRLVEEHRRTSDGQLEQLLQRQLL